MSRDEGAAFARKHGCLFVETSAKANVAVGQAFEELVRKVCGLQPVATAPMSPYLSQSNQSVHTPADLWLQPATLLCPHTWDGRLFVCCLAAVHACPCARFKCRPWACPSPQQLWSPTRRSSYGCSTVTEYVATC